MAKKSLKQKIELVGFWTFGFIFWYLVVAFFLNSNYPIYNYKFNPSLAYDVIKDALGLAAAFLAPVAAFVLFGDWRDEYYGKKKISDLDDFICAIKKIVESLETYCKKVEIIQIEPSNQFVDLDDNTKLRTEINELIEKLHNLADEDKQELDQEVQKFINLIDEANTHLYSANFAKNSLKIEYYINNKNNEEDNKENNIKLYEKMCKQHMYQYRIKFHNINHIKIEIISNIKKLKNNI